MIKNSCLNAAIRIQYGICSINVGHGFDFHGFTNCGFLPGDEERISLSYQILFVGNLDQRLHYTNILVIKVSNIILIP